VASTSLFSPSPLQFFISVGQHYTENNLLRKVTLWPQTAAFFSLIITIYLFCFLMWHPTFNTENCKNLKTLNVRFLPSQGMKSMQCLELQLVVTVNSTSGRRLPEFYPAHTVDVFLLTWFLRMQIPAEKCPRQICAKSTSDVIQMSALSAIVRKCWGARLGARQ